MPALTLQAAGGENLKANCNETAQHLVEYAWKIYPRNTSKRSGDPKLSVTLPEQALVVSPECQWALRHISDLYHELESFQLAKKYNDKNLFLYPNDTVAKSTRSDIAFHEGKVEESIAILESIIAELGTDSGYWHYALARIYAYEGNTSKSLDMLEIAASVSKGWLDENNAQASETFAEVVKQDRFKRLLEE